MADAIPVTWGHMDARLAKAGVSEGERRRLRAAWSLGAHAALQQLGQTSNEQNVFKVWHEYAAAAELDARDSIVVLLQKGASSA